MDYVDSSNIGINDNESEMGYRLTKSQNLAHLYLYLCSMVEVGKHEFCTDEVVERFGWSHPYAWQQLSRFMVWGYMQRISDGKRGTVFRIITPPHVFSRPTFKGFAKQKVLSSEL